MQQGDWQSATVRAGTELSRNPATPAIDVNHDRARRPISSAVAGPMSRTHIMLNRMCSRLPCSQVALSTRPPRPSARRPDSAPLAPNNSTSAQSIGARNDRPPPATSRSAAGQQQRDHVQRSDETPITSGTNPKSEPKLPEQRRESPQAGIGAAAHVARCVVARRPATRTTGQTTDPWSGAEDAPAQYLLTFRPHVRREDPLPQPDARRRHLHQLVVVDELDRLLEAELARRNEPDRFVGRSRRACSSASFPS